VPPSSGSSTLHSSLFTLNFFLHVSDPGRPGGGLDGRWDKLVAARRENVLAALRAIREQKLRSFLTCLGIIIGVGTVIVMVSLVQGFNSTFIAQFQNFGATLVQFQRLDDRFGGVARSPRSNASVPS